MEKKPAEEKIQDFVEKFLPYFLKLWKNWKKLLIINGIVLILSFLYLLLLVKSYYESTVSILPEYGNKSSMLSQLSGLASLAGVSVGSGAPTEIYQNLLQGESVMAPVIYRMYLTKEYPDSVNLIQYFKVKIKDPNPEIQKRKQYLAVNDLLIKALVSTDLDRMTKILTVKVTMPEAQLSADVVNKLVESLDQYIRTKRRSYAGEQRYYLEKRVDQIKDSLRICENKLKDFREQNRMIAQSPNLLLDQGRLMRNVEIQQNVYIELTKQLELAKIDEIRDAPILNINENAQNPIKKAGPNKLSRLILIFFFSVLLSCAYFLFEDMIKRTYKFIRTKKSGS
jgi:uncharacterized protein involved in exopolysaccharide biosynthesis